MKAHGELKSILDSEQDLKETEDYITALQVLVDAEKELPDDPTA